tara:strand:+ start:966 stop:1241 length:276 start_codon:yes stop_codon:yes gene_type:complete
MNKAVLTTIRTNFTFKLRLDSKGLLTLLEYFTNKQKEKTMNIKVNIILFNDGYAIVINDKTIPIDRRRLPTSLLLEVEKEGSVTIKVGDLI